MNKSALQNRGIEQNRMSPSEIEQAVAHIVRKRLGDRYRIFLFGSRARGTARPSSDYDIGVEGPAVVPFSILARIESDIEDLPTLATIDVVDMSSASERLTLSARAAAKEL